jgi:hypothetical protein
MNRLTPAEYSDELSVIFKTPADMKPNYIKTGKAIPIPLIDTTEAAVRKRSRRNKSQSVDTQTTKVQP